MSSLDAVISGGWIADGSGAAPFRANIGILNGRIAAVDSGVLHADRVIEADGRVVAPGFIDLHSHAEYRVQAEPAAETVLLQGVTTLVTGNCGFSPFPVADLGLLRSWSTFLGDGLRWDWTDFESFCEAVDRSHPGVNIAPQMGHAALRLAAMGDGERPPSSAELQTMVDLLQAAAVQGCWGFSTGLIYAPGSFSDSSEVAALAAVAARNDMLYSTHLRDETSRLADAVAEAIACSEETGVRLQISHLKAMGPGNHGGVHQALKLIDGARERGVDVAADVYPYTASATTLTSRLPGWALDGGTAALLSRLRVPTLRDRMAAEIRGRFGSDIDPDGVVVSELGEGPYRDRIGQSLADIGAGENVDPAEAMLRILERHGAEASIINHAMNEADVEAVLAHPVVSVASDGDQLSAGGSGPTHPRSFGTFPRVLGRYVRERGLLELSEAVRKMTSLPASRLGLSNRGRILPGMVADLTVFDPESVADRATYEDPRRMSVGITDVLIAGQAAVSGGQVAAQRFGSVLRRL